jgi:phage I-like protein
MPWSVANPPRPATNWPQPAKALCVRVANAVLRQGGKDQDAIYACIRAVKNKYPSAIKAPKSEWRKAASDFFDAKTNEEILVIFSPLLPDLIELAPWKSATKTGLPDSAYAIVYTKPDGTKIRALPHHKSGGALDLPHLRNALARWNQVKGVPDAIKKRGLAHLEAHARGAGVGDHDKKKAASEFTAQFYTLPALEFRESNGRFTSTLQVLPEGKFTHPWYGDLDFTAPVLRAMKRNFDKKVLGTDIMVDEGHDRGKALGWYRDLHVGKRAVSEQEYSGLWADIEWTELGREYLEKQFYRYFSAEVGNWTSPSGEKYKNILLGGGLTNRPFFKQMPEIQFAEGQATDRFVIGLFGDEQWAFETSENTNEDSEFSSGFHEPVFEEEETEDMDELIAAINAAYKQDFSTADEVLAYMEDLQSPERLKTTFTALGVEFKDGDDVVAVVAKAFKSATDKNAETDTRLRAVEKRLRDSEFEQLFSENLRAGKVLPKQKDSMRKLFEKDSELFTELMGTQEPVINFTEVGSTGDVEPGSSDERRFQEGSEETRNEVSRYAKLVEARNGGSKRVRRGE